MQVCLTCDKRAECRVPKDFARFQRVYDHLQAHDGLEFLRQRLRVFLHINHCIAEGEMDLIHNMVVEHFGPEHEHVNAWGIPDDARQHMIELRRHSA
ncbi:hypothetical protein [Paramagnetospirillum marisnigri]|nr:hypothetical protein [Paramagnetospirillum marisnigri]